MKRLTLSLSDEIIKKVKDIAKQRNMSVSRLVSEYIESLDENTPVLNQLSGILGHKDVNCKIRSNPAPHSD